MILDLTAKEILEFQYILPVQGDILSLELAENILKKVKILDEEFLKNNESKRFNFCQREIDLLFKMIHILDKNKQVRLSSLSLIKKILKLKGDTNV